MSSEARKEFLDNEFPRINDVQDLVMNERWEQFQKWANQARKPDAIWVLILMEEFGESVAEIMFGDVTKAKTELIQMTAVSNAWAEAISERGINEVEESRKGFDTAIFLTFIKFGEFAKAILEEDYEQTFNLSLQTINEITMLRKQIVQDHLNKHSRDRS